MSRLNPSLLVLDKGLDLQSAKIVAPPGTSLDTLNYEQIDFQGQKRIDGYARYDGSVLSAIDDYLVVSDVVTEEYPPYTLAFNNDRLLGVVVAEGRIAVIDYTNIPDTAVWGVDYEATPEDHYNNLLTYNAYLRTQVESLPGPVIGLHWFRDRLYAVADFGQYQPDDDRVDGTGMATLWESRSVQQVLEEDGPSDPYDFGWKFVHQGWTVYFDNGRVLYGDLTALNQNRQNVGVQGPTSIAGSNGAPLSLLQRVDVTAYPAQVNGWKSSDTPTTYVLNPNDVAETDSDYTYADAFISWDGTTGVVTPPALAEWPANNTVEVDI